MNCIVVDDDDTSRKLIEYFIGQTDFLILTHSFSSSVKALSFLSENETDLIFLDIQMPEVDGMEFIKTTRHKLAQIILVSSHKEFAIEAFEYNITDYLVKPISYSRFFKAALKSKEIFEKDTKYHLDNDIIFLKKGQSLIRAKKSDILWVEAAGDYVVLNTSLEKFILHTTMNAIEEKLPVKDYLRVHRSYIVRIDIIDSIEDDVIAFNGQTKLIPIGKTYRDNVLKRLNSLM